eukprot:jgi/Botrbrau1/15173/Bobra.0149s0038.1
MKQSEAWLVLHSTAIKVYTNSRIASGIRLRVHLYLQDKCASCPLAKKDVLTLLRQACKISVHRILGNKDVLPGLDREAGYSAKKLMFSVLIVGCHSPNSS